MYAALPRKKQLEQFATLHVLLNNPTQQATRIRSAQLATLGVDQ